MFGGLYDRVSGNEVYHGLDFPITISDAQPSSAAGYAQLDVRVVDALKLIGGVQVNKIKGREAGWVPRLGAILTLPGGLHAKALYGEAFRAPSINELSLAHPGLQGDPNLNPERTANFDLSLGYSARRGQVTASYFRNKQTDIIVQDHSHDARQLHQRGGGAHRRVRGRGQALRHQAALPHGLGPLPQRLRDRAATRG